jgi:hypothetical protein
MAPYNCTWNHGRRKKSGKIHAIWRSRPMKSKCVEANCIDNKLRSDDAIYLPAEPELLLLWWPRNTVTTELLRLNNASTKPATGHHPEPVPPIFLSPYILKLSSNPIPSLPKCLYTFLRSPIPATCPAHHTPHHFTALIILTDISHQVPPYVISSPTHLRYLFQAQIFAWALYF